MLSREMRSFLYFVHNETMGIKHKIIIVSLGISLQHSKDLNFPRVARIDSHFGPFREIIKPICFLFIMKKFSPHERKESQPHFSVGLNDRRRFATALAAREKTIIVVWFKTSFTLCSVYIEQISLSVAHYALFEHLISRLWLFRTKCKGYNILYFLLYIVHCIALVLYIVHIFFTWLVILLAGSSTIIMLKQLETCSQFRLTGLVRVQHGSGSRSISSNCFV